MKLTTLLMLGLGLVEVEAKTDKDQKMKKKQKDKKSRMLRNLRKEAPVTLNDDGDVTFYNEAISIQCLTGQGDYAGMGAELTNTEAKALVCQSKYIYRFARSMILFHRIDTIPLPEYRL